MTFSAKVINLAHAIKNTRARGTGSPCLAAELKQTLLALQPLLDEGQLDFIEVSGSKASILLRGRPDAWRSPENLIEAYSLRMMTTSLRNLGATFLSITLSDEVRTARQALLQSLQDLHVLLSDLQTLPPPVTPPAPQPQAVQSDTADTAAREALIAQKRALEQQKDAVLESLLRDADAATLMQRDDSLFWQLFEPLGRRFDVGELDAAQLEQTMLAQIRTTRTALVLAQAQADAELQARRMQAARDNSVALCAVVIEQQAQRPDFTEMDAADCVLETLNQIQIPGVGATPISGIRVINVAALQLSLKGATPQNRPLALLEQQLSAQQPTELPHPPAWFFCQAALWALAQIRTQAFHCNLAAQNRLDTSQQPATER